MKKQCADQIECLEVIGQNLAASVPEAWKDIETKVSIADRVPLISNTYLPATEGAKREYFGLGSVERLAEVSDCFLQLRQFVGNTGQGYFKSCRYVLTSDGRYRADYEY